MSEWQNEGFSHERSIFLIFRLIALVLLFASCSDKPKLAETATLSEFDGKWTGEWNWVDGTMTTLEIKQGKIKYWNFPASSVNKLDVVVTGEGELEFKQQWSTPAPCILVSMPDTKLLVPIYISKDKQNLYYPVSTKDRKNIVFSKK